MISQVRSQEATPPPCPACDGQVFQKLFVKMERHFWRCTHCHLERQYPLPTLEDLQDYYQHAYLSGMYKPFVEAKELKRETAKQRFKMIRAHCRPGLWLDVGASTGSFVSYARAQGMEAEGLDFTPEAVREAQEEGLPVHCSTLETYDPPYRFDTITAFDILEHVLNPVSFLHAMRNLIVPGGTFALAVPNQSSLHRRLMGKHWFYYIPEEHLYYYNPSCIRQLLEQCGLEMSSWSGALKPLTLNYMLIWLQARNPLIHKLLSPMSRLVKHRLAELSFPCPVGDMMVLGRRLEAWRRHSCP